MIAIASVGTHLKRRDGARGSFELLPFAGTNNHFESKRPVDGPKLGLYRRRKAKRWSKIAAARSRLQSQVVCISATDPRLVMQTLRRVPPHKRGSTSLGSRTWSIQLVPLVHLHPTCG